MEMSASNVKHNELLDALYLELLHLIEQQTSCRVNIEKLSKGGQLLLAKTRYNQGTNAISTAQIPTADGEEFKALCRVKEETTESSVAHKTFKLEKQYVDKENGFVQPMHWFGALPSSSLRMAAEQFAKCMELVVESANIQTEMLAIMESIGQVKRAIQ